MARTTVRTPIVEFARKGSAAPAPDGDVVRRKGVIFRAGVYPSQSYAMTPAELEALAADFSPVPIDAGHPSSASPLDGQLGHLEAVELSEDGTTLFGTVAMPAWLEERLGDARRLVSASFDRATKRLRSLSLVTRPQIEDAELLAAFACACGHEAGTTTTTETETEDPPMDEKTRKARALALVESMDEDDLAVMLGEAGPEAPEAEAKPEPAGPSAAEFAAQRRIEELEAKDRRRDAEVFVDAAIKDALVLPEERAGLIARHAQFALLEQATPAEFSQGKPLTLVKDFQADIRARRPHSWTKETVASFGRPLENGSEAGGETPEQRRARLDARLENTSTGRAILARRNGAAR